MGGDKPGNCLGGYGIGARSIFYRLSRLNWSIFDGPPINILIFL